MKGLKKFTPQEFELASENCTRFFTAMGEEVRAICAELGYERAQDLVGRSDLLVQSRAVHDVDVLEMIKPLEEFLDLEPIDLPAPEEERSAPGLVVGAPDPDAAQGGIAPAGGARHRGVRRHAGQALLPACGRRRRPRAGHRAGRRAGARTHLPPGHGAGGQRGHAGAPPLRRRLGGGPGPWRLQRLRRGHHRRGRRPGRRGEDDARRQDRGHEGHEPLRASASTARWASRSPTAPSAGGCSCRATPTRASASASRAPTW